MSLAFTLAGVSVLKLELVAVEIAHAEGVQIHMDNVNLEMLILSAHHENDESMIFKTRLNLTCKPTLILKENRYEREH